MNYNLALHGTVQQCYDSSITQAEILLPQLMPQYDLTYPEFKMQLQKK